MFKVRLLKVKFQIYFCPNICFVVVSFVVLLLLFSGSFTKSLIKCNWPQPFLNPNYSSSICMLLFLGNTATPQVICPFSFPFTFKQIPTSSWEMLR